MTATPDIALTAAFDRPLAWYRGGSMRYLVLTLTAPPAAERPLDQTPPLNLALVIDASGSMSGPPLDAAVRAARGVVERLGPRDTLSLVSFASDVVLHNDGMTLNAHGRHQVLAQLALLATRGNTDLAGGWLAGADCAARVMEGRPGTANRVLLLSDGYANAGITEPEVLGHHAAELRKRGLFSSTVGIGAGYSTDQLEAIATHGGGTLHDAETPEEIVEVVLGELGQMSRVAADDITVTLRFPAEARLEVLGGLPVTFASGEARIAAGMLLAENERTVVVRVRAPEGEPGATVPFEAAVTWRDPEGAARAVGPAAAALALARGRQNESQQRDAALSLTVAQIWQSDIVRAAVRVNREGNGRRAWFERQLGYFRRYCSGLEGAAPLVTELERMVGVIEQDWGERARKQVHIAQYQAATSTADLRATPRPAWDTYLPPQQQSPRA